MFLQMFGPLLHPQLFSHEFIQNIIWEICFFLLYQIFKGCIKSAVQRLKKKTYDPVKVKWKELFSAQNLFNQNLKYLPSTFVTLKQQHAVCGQSEWVNLLFSLASWPSAGQSPRFGIFVHFIRNCVIMTLTGSLSELWNYVFFSSI